MIHVGRSFAFDRRGRLTLYRLARLCASSWIGAEDVDSEIGSHPLPWGVVMSEKEKGRTLALSLTHRVGEVEVAWRWKSPPGC